jgi:hypothetical protein
VSTAILGIVRNTLDNSMVLQTTEESRVRSKTAGSSVIAEQQDQRDGGI